MSVLSSAPQPVYVRPARSIGGIVMDVTVEEAHTDELEITEHPVQQGASVADHAFLLPAKVSITAGASDSGGSGGDRRCVEIYEALLDLQGKRDPFDLVTGKRVYRNMLIKSLSTTTDERTERVLLVTAELQEVILATVQTVAVPRSRQRNALATGGVDQRGRQQMEPVQPGKSALKIGSEIF
jgi:hypothetical protein